MWKSLIEIITEQVTKKLFPWVVTFSIYGKMVAVLILAILLFFSMRLGFVGEDMRRWSYVLPIESSFIDQEIFLDFDFKVERIGEPVNSILGEKYRSTDKYELLVNTDMPCWMMIFGIDDEGVFAVRGRREDSPTKPFSKYFRPQKGAFSITFDHEGAFGRQVYFAIASHRKIDYSRDIEPKLRELLNKAGMKGLSFQYYLNLDNHLFQKAVYFDVVPKQ